MRAIGIKALKNQLSEYIRVVETGEEVLITDRDRVVAELVPPRARSSHVSDALLAEWVRQGVITPALFPPGPLSTTPPRSESLKQVLDELTADREGR